MLAGSTPALSTLATCCGTQTGKAANFKRSCLRVRLPPAVLRFKQASGRTDRESAFNMSFTATEKWAMRGFRFRLACFNPAGATGVQLTFIRSVCSARYRDLQLRPSSDLEKPTTWISQRCGWASAQPGLIRQDRRVRPPDPLLTKVEYANRQSGKHERLVILQVRLLSRLLQSKHDRVVQRLRRLRDKQETDGSIPSVITETKGL